MRRARIVRIEWNVLEPAHEDYLGGALDVHDIKYALEKAFREYTFTISGDPSFEVKEDKDA